MHTKEEQIHGFDTVEQVVIDTLRFKRKLAIGEDAYASLRISKRLQQLWDVGGVAASGAGLAASPTIAGTFFASSGWMASIGLGASATTPIGWIIGDFKLGQPTTRTPVRVQSRLPPINMHL